MFPPLPLCGYCKAVHYCYCIKTKNKDLVLATLLKGADEHVQTNAKKPVYVKGGQLQYYTYISNPFVVNNCEFILEVRK